VEDAWLPFGVLRRPHGMQGEILLAPHNPGGDRGWVDTLPMPVQCSKPERVVDANIVALRPASGGFLVRLEGMNTRSAVADLAGAEVRFPRQRLAHLSAHEFYVEDLLGCEVVRQDGRRLGRVERTFWNGAHDVMSVVAENGDEQWLPVLPGFILRFDAVAKRLTVDPHD
jgi:16S rRNA processing protein RimM